MKFKEIPSLLGFFKELPEYSADLFINKKSKATLENAPVMLRAAIETLSAIENWQVDTIHDALIALAQSLEVKNGTLLWPVRIAAAGQTVTPAALWKFSPCSAKRRRCAVYSSAFKRSRTHKARGKT